LDHYNDIYKLKLQAAFIGVQAVQIFKAFKHEIIKRH